MLPLGDVKYRRLLISALGLGLVAGAFSLLFIVGTEGVLDLVFEASGFGWWEGSWWWIPITAAGGALVAGMRHTWRLPTQSPSATKGVEEADALYPNAFKWLAVSTVSLLVGASLGPSFAFIIGGGALGQWAAHRWWPQRELDDDYVLTGMAGGLGGAFTAPILGAFFVSELGPTPKQRYVAAIIPQLLAATGAFLLFYLTVGRTFLGIYEVPTYEFELSHMWMGVLIGIAAFTVMAFVAFASRLVIGLVSRFGGGWIQGLIGGAGVGLIAFALPLTFGSGNSQLREVLDDPFGRSVAFLLVVLAAKVVALALSQWAGFVGGTVFPIIFIGGLAGVCLHALFPELPLSLSVGASMAAVPGAFLQAPISLTILALMTTELDPLAAAPISVAVITAYLLASIVTGRRNAE